MDDYCGSIAELCTSPSGRLSINRQLPHHPIVGLGGLNLITRYSGGGYKFDSPNDL